MSQQKFNNKILVEPQAISKFTVGITPKANPLATGRVIVIGESESGAPNEIHWFTDKSGAKDVLRGGNSLKAMGYIFNPSPQHDGAPYCGFVRAQTTTTAEHDATSGKIVSKDYGTWVNNIQIKIEDGTTDNSNKITVVYGDTTEVFDNLDLGITIQYVGSGASGLLEITAGDHIIGSAGVSASEVVEFDYDLTESTYNTISKVVAAIDALADWDCSIFALGAAGIGTLNSIKLNTLGEGDVKSTELDLQCYPNIAEYVLDNFSAFVNGTVETDGTQLTNQTSFVFLAGGTAASMDTAAITAALTLIEEANCQAIWIDSETAADHALVTAHCQANPYFRMGFFGLASQTTAVLAVSTTLAAAALMNSAYAALVGCGIDDFAEDGSGTEAIGPKYFAAKCAGLMGGLPVQEPLTRKVFNAQGLQYEFSLAQREALIRGGVLAPKNMDGIGLVINQGINTLQNNLNLWDGASQSSPEISLMRSAGQFNKELAVAANTQFIGGTVGVGRATIIGFVEAHCKTKEAEGVLAPDDSDPDNSLPAWENITATRLEAGDGWSVSVAIRLNNPFNFFLIETIAVL